MQHDQSRRNKIILIAIVAVFALLVIALSILAFFNGGLGKTNGSANIKGISTDSCANAIPSSMENTINSELYVYIKSANTYNHVSTNKFYQSNVRSGTCKTKNNSDGTYTTTATIDIPEARQSWNINFAWSTSMGQSAELGSLASQSGGSVTCPDASQLIYGDFHCENVLTYIDAQNILSYCSMSSDNRPSYTGWQVVRTSGNWSLDDGADSTLEQKLNSVLQPQNTAQTDSNNKVACVSVVSTDNAQTVNPNVNVTTNFNVQFVTSGGAITTHDISYVVDMNFDVTVFLDGKQI